MATATVPPGVSAGQSFTFTPGALSESTGRAFGAVGRWGMWWNRFRGFPTEETSPVGWFFDLESPDLSLKKRVHDPIWGNDPMIEGSWGVVE